MKAIVIDKNEQSRETILSILKNIQNIELLNNFENFSDELNYTNLDIIIFDINSKNIFCLR